jgi:hypothetical protein
MRDLFSTMNAWEIVGGLMAVGLIWLLIKIIQIIIWLL